MHTDNHPAADKTKVVNLLRDYEVAPTRQRVAIGTVLFACHQHLAASELLHRVQLHDTRISRSTVYNTLDLFVEKGLLQEVSLGGRPRIYDTNLVPHHHVYHVDSGEVEDLDLSQVEVNVPKRVLGHSSLVGVDIILRVVG